MNRIPVNIYLEVEFDVCCTRITSTAWPMLKVALHKSADWERILSQTQKDTLRDHWAMYETSHGCFSKETALLEFEVIFSGKNEIENISLNGIDINDIIPKEMENELCGNAKANFEKELKDG